MLSQAAPRTIRGAPLGTRHESAPFPYPDMSIIIGEAQMSCLPRKVYQDKKLGEFISYASVLSRWHIAFTPNVYANLSEHESVYSDGQLLNDSVS